MMCLYELISITLLLNWSAIIVFPLTSLTAFVGDGFALLSFEVFVKYWKTMCFEGVTSMILECPESVIRVFPLGSLLANEAIESPWLYSQTMWPDLVISIIRLLFSSAMRICPLERSSALFGEFKAPGPEAGPYAQTICLCRLTSI